MGSLVGRLLCVVLAACALSAPAEAASYAKGVDVSHWNGAVDWTRVVTASYRFVFAKATEGRTLIDPTYAINRAGGASLGLRVGGYHFARPAGSSDAARVANAIAQADFFLSVAQPQPGELPPALDLEANGGLSPKSLDTWTNAWLGEIAARTGVSGVVYASPSFWKSSLGDTASVAGAGHDLWIAHWTKRAAPLVPADNWNGQGWTFWQWTDCSKVPGFLHCSDGDRYNGADPAPVAIAPYPGGAPASSSPPTVVGTARTGRMLAGVPGTWSGGKPLTFLYQWQRCDAAGAGCAPIPGATAETYVPGAADVGHALTLAVTAQASAGSATATSPATVAVAAGGSAAARPAVVTAPALAGTAQAGQTLTASVGAWTGSPASFALQWQRCDASGAQCAAIPEASGTTYTLTPGDIGTTISLVVTATGKGGSTSAPAVTTAAVAAAPVPPPVPGSAVAQPALAGAVASADGRAVVTWQPGAVPLGSTVTLASEGPSFALTVAPAPRQLPWPVDVAFPGADATSVVGVSANGRLWRPAPRLTTAALPVDETAGTTIDAAGGLHVLLRLPEQLQLFTPGSWGDPTRVAAGLPKPHLASRLRVTRLRDGSLRIRTRVRVPSQAKLATNVTAHTRVVRRQLLRPGAVPVSARFHLAPGRSARLRIVAVDPYGRRASLVVRFRAP